MADVVVIDGYVMEPSTCLLCGSGQRQVPDGDDGTRRERIVDTNLDFDFYGRVYACESCLTHIGVTLLGFLSPGARAVLEAANAALQSRLDQALAELRDVDAALSALRRLDTARSGEALTTDEQLPDFMVRVDDGWTCAECDGRPFATFNGARQHVERSTAHAHG